jgi:hypothetical protein
MTNRIPKTIIHCTSRSLLVLLAGLTAVDGAVASEREELLTLKNTTVNLIELLVEQGLVDKQKAQNLIKAAEQKAALETKQQLAEESARTDVEAGKTPKSVRVAYVPEFVKAEIRDQVRAELKADVVKDVKADAQKEAWGIPGALPEWVANTKITGDARLRAQEDWFGGDNDPKSYLDFRSINSAGGKVPASRQNSEYLNTTKDRLRFRERFRLAIDSKVTDQIHAGLRLSTTNDYSPVSSNQTLGNTGKSWEVALDRAFLEYNYQDGNGNDLLTLSGGRIANPWLSTDMMYSPDLSFEGFTGTVRLKTGQRPADVKSYKDTDTSGRFGLQTGRQDPDSVFMTVGAFPLQEVNFSSADKWLFGGQLGGDWMLWGSSRLRLAAAYYDYRNISARPNGLNSYQNDWTAPQFMQKGNTMVPIVMPQNSDPNGRCYKGGASAAETGCLWGLASEFRIFNTTAMYDIPAFGDKHVLLSADYAKNMGFDAGSIARNFPGYWQTLTAANQADKTNAFQVRADIGKQEIRHFNDWSALVAYRYIQRDAILDAFTDSVFHQGGTDAQGWMMGFSYGVARNTWLNLRWFSTESIDGPPLSVDTGTLDLNVRL